MVVGQRYSIGVIGAGELGSRHLQAIALVKEPLDVYVIDPNPQSLETAKSRWEEVAGDSKHNVYFEISMGCLSSKLMETVIIATDSKHRKSVIFELLSTVGGLKNLILEKVLFQKLQDYQEVEALLKNSDTKVFVNCPRRMIDIYKKIKGIIVDQPSIHIDVVGNNWGLGCNGIHMVDIFSFFLNDDKLQISWNDNGLDTEVLASTRANYSDFSGRLFGQTTNGSLSLTSFATGEPNVSIRITTAGYRIIMDEHRNVCSIEDMSNFSLEEQPIDLKYQSNLTNLVIESLIHTSSCELTPYKESMNLHLSFLSALLDHLPKIEGRKVEICPIT